MDTHSQPGTDVPESPVGALAFAGFILDFGQRILLDPDGNRLTLTTKTFDTLAYLASHPGQTLSRQDIMAAVWPRSVVSENNLNQAIRAVRKALGDTDNRIIHTLPGEGYRFAVESRPTTPLNPPSTSWSLDRDGLKKAAVGIVIVVLILVAALAVL